MAGKMKVPFEMLGARRRERTLLIRFNDDEMRMLEELASMLNVSRSNVMRTLLKQAHVEKVEKPIRAAAEVDIEREAQRLAINQRIDDLRKELLAGARARAKTKSKSR